MNHHDEWLEPDGLGGFASGTVSGERTRRYHALLLNATTPPTGRMVLMNGIEAWVATPSATFPVSSQRYAPDVVFPDGATYIETFTTEPWPRWVYRLPDGTRVEQELFAVRGRPTVGLRWRLLEPREGVTLTVRPLLSGRDYHRLHHENAGFRFDATVDGESVVWEPYPGVPRTTVCSNGVYTHEPVWYRNFLYLEERERGLDYTEDLASPGKFAWNLSRADAVWILSAGVNSNSADSNESSATAHFSKLREREQDRRQTFASPLDRAADAYLVDGRHGRSIIAGYPWFTDWGRDTFLALRGLCLATGRLDDARDILLSWALAVSQGMLPNRFPDQTADAEYNSVDASLWYVVAAGEFFDACDCGQFPLAPHDRDRLQSAVDAILTGYRQGTRYGIRLDADGLLACGQPGVQLTWMDVKIGDWVVTPRCGKPVEIQALWLNALRIASRWSDRWRPLLEQGLAEFEKRFWNQERGMLYDVVDVDHRPGAVDATFRPNQVLAVGGLPVAVLEGERARSVVEQAERHLWTPLGLRSLAPTEPLYAAHYEGGPRQRDSVYHQGTVWPWLIGPFVEAWLRVHGQTPSNRQQARRRFLAPLIEHLHHAGLGHVSEIADAEPPHTPRGCPFQAWSLGELLRLDRIVLAESRSANRRPVQPGPAQPTVA